MPHAGIIALGLVTGSLAGLNSIGFVLLWRTSRVVNLAQPALGLVGGVLTGMLVARAGWGFWWAAPIGLALGALLSIAAERAVLSRLQDVPRSVLLIATVGLAQVFSSIYTAIPFIFGGTLPTYSVELGMRFFIGPQLLLGPHVLALVALPAVAWGVHTFLTRSRLGVASLALGQDAERARSLGVPASLIRVVVWGIAGAIASITGVLSIPILGFGLEGGALTATVLLLALAPAVFVGLRSIWGAAAVALVLGVVHQMAIFWMRGGGRANLILAVAVVLAVAVQRRRLGRDETAARASSWDAAATTRPLPWHVSSSNRVFVAGLVIVALAVLAAAIPPMFMAAGDRVLYGTGAAFALGAMGVATAWMFAGELPLGHWGFAGLGAALAALTPGPWPVRTWVAAIAIAALNLVLAYATRRRSALAFAVIGLAAAAAAPVAVTEIGRGVIRADTADVGATAGVLVVLSAVLLTRIRSSSFGARVIAARDDPQRGPWLGADPMVGRLVGLTLSGAMVGAAGALFVASTPAGIAPGAFDPERSLALLAIAVVGGLGSPTGVLLGAIALTAGERLLPSPWNGLLSGAGVVAVVVFLPAGIARLIERVRDLGVRLLVGRGAAAGNPAPMAVEREVA